ncbi:acyltransferase [Nocardioides sp. C4-1]|uniref:acyltransferase family protein n=1 Tax=Nocardioides sp. C4-1 TaxID=3151851 RepID=UPI0032669A62
MTAPSTEQAADAPARASSSATFAHNRSLDGLRAIAVLVVVVAHGSTRFLPPEMRFGGGAVGVGIFFVLSGYLITSLLLRERAATGRISVRDFYVRRALRIWPLYYVVLLLHLLVLSRVDAGPPLGGTWLSRDAPTYSSLGDVGWSYFLFLQNYVASVQEVRLGLGVYWSLAIEEQYYLVWPPVVILLTAARVRWRLALPAFLVVAIATSLVARILTLEGHLPSAPGGVEWMAHTNIFGLAVGSLLAWVRWDSDHRGRPGAGGGAFGAWLAWAVVVLLVLRRWVYAPELGVRIGLSHAEIYEPLLLSVAVAAIVDRVVTHEWRWSPLRWAPLVYVGRVSYGVYLLHPIVLGFLTAWLTGTGWVEMGLFILVSTGVAAVSYELFERRVLRYKRRFSHVRHADVAPEVGSAGRDDGDAAEPGARTAAGGG